MKYYYIQLICAGGVVIFPGWPGHPGNGWLCCMFLLSSFLWFMQSRPKKEEWNFFDDPFEESREQPPGSNSFIAAYNTSYGVAEAKEGEDSSRSSGAS